MTFSIYLYEKLTKRLDKVAAESGKARNALIREALEEQLARSRGKKWPETVLAFKGVRGAPRFEEARKLMLTGNQVPSLSGVPTSDQLEAKLTAN